MAVVKRYDMDVGGDPIESKEGEWVKYEDILPAVKRAFEEGKKVGKREGENTYRPTADFAGSLRNS